MAHANASTSVVCHPLLSADECERLVAAVPDETWEPGRVLAPGGGAAEAVTVRSCRVSHALEPDLARRVEAHVEAVNARHFRFDLRGVSRLDPAAVLRYERGDAFAWHVDNGVAEAPFGTRKLSFVVQLSDPDAYDGGDLELAAYAQAYGGDAFRSYAAQLRVRGAVVIYAAFHLHRVTALRRGTRHALVGWLHGPPFR